MKKVLQITIALSLLFTAVESKAQLSQGSIAPDWTFSDINGVSYHLDSILDAGKTVFIDISATWCSPCWNYHQSGALDNLWANHGPTGGTGVLPATTNDVMVFFIEGELTNTTAQLYGPQAITGQYSTETQGDWVTGTNYPIIDFSSSTAGANTFLTTNYHIGYFPTVYMICPDRSVTEVSPSMPNGLTTAAQLYTAKGNCYSATVPADAEMITSGALNPSLASCDSVTPTFRLGNIGTLALTSATINIKVDGTTEKTINWTGSLATYANTIVTGVKVGSSTSGSHTITAVVSNPNGSVDPTPANNSTAASFIVYPAVGGAYISESFESAGIPTNWIITAGGSSTWDNSTAVGFNSSACTTLNWYGISNGQIDYMTLPPMSFANATVASLTFDVAYAQYSSSSTDKLEVQVSTNCGTSWTNKYNKSGTTLKTTAADTSEFIPASTSEWRHEVVNLTTYAGQSNVLVRFKGTSNFGNDVYIDNVNFSATTSIKENDLAISNVNVYPNPVTNNAVIDFSLTEPGNVSVTVINALGQLVFNKDLGRMNTGVQNYLLDAASLSNGLYFLNIKIGNNTVTKKVAVNK